MPEGRQPNVVLVTIDTLRADHVGHYGYEAGDTSTLDALAAEGTSFENAISSAPLTLPSHASILTGLHPPHHGARHNALYRIPESTETLAEHFQEAGYATGAVVGAAVLSRRYGLHQGFDLYDDSFSSSRSADSGFFERDAAEVTRLAEAWLTGAGEPFFLWVHYFDPHLDYDPPEPYAQRYRAHPYDGEIAFVDDQLGNLIHALQAKGVLEQTIVAVTSDHGESLGEHRERDHSYTLYDATLHVPLILRGPGVPRAEKVPDLVRGIDLAPTLLHLAGLSGMSESDAAVLPGMEADEEREPRLAYAETLATKLDFGWSPIFAIRSATHLFVRAPRAELYDLNRDPTQLRNLLEANPDERTMAMAKIFEHEIDRVLGGEVQATSVELEPRQIDRLRALGYVASERPIEPTGLDPKEGLLLLAEFRDAVTTYTGGDLPGALARLAPVVQRLPESSLAHWIYGNALMQSGDHESALRELEEASRLSPLSARYRAMLGELRRRSGDPDGAALDFEEAAKLDSSEPMVQVGLAWLSWRRGDEEAAIAHSRSAAREGALEPTIHKRLADLWLEQGRREEGAGALRAALELRPDWAKTRIRLAAELAQLGRVEESEIQRRQAGSLGSAPRFALQLGGVYEETAAFEAARRLYQDSLSTWPPDRRVLEALDRLP